MAERRGDWNIIAIALVLRASREPIADPQYLRGQRLQVGQTLEQNIELDLFAKARVIRLRANAFRLAMYRVRPPEIDEFSVRFFSDTAGSNGLRVSLEGSVTFIDEPRNAVYTAFGNDREILDRVESQNVRRVEGVLEAYRLLMTKQDKPYVTLKMKGQEQPVRLFDARLIDVAKTLDVPCSIAYTEWLNKKGFWNVIALAPLKSRFEV
jgi:hypothetical protein